MNAYGMTMEWARDARIRTLGLLECASTNLDAKAQHESLGHRSLVVADHQTAGRGRGDHSWIDTCGQSLLSSWIFQTPTSPQPVMSALIGLSLFESARKTWPGLTWALKAPNDLHIVGATGGAKKVAGILIELVSIANRKPSSGAAVIVGLGMNVTDSPADTKPYPATSLAQELSGLGVILSEADWSRFLTTWLNAADEAVKAGLSAQLSPSSTLSLTTALRIHPEHSDIEDVKPDGSLVFKNGRTTPWTAL